jgi:uncharacterized HAD superfamily protein
MKIGIDMDSVIAEIMEPMYSFHNAKYKTNASPKDQNSYDLTSIWNCSHIEALNRINEFYASSYFHETKPVEGSVEGIKHLLRQHHQLILVTSRPPYMEQKSITWLNEHFKGSFIKVCHTNQVSHEHEKKRKKSEICLEENVEVMIEDHIDYAVDCASVGIRVFLFNMPWNQTKALPKGIRRVFSWKEIIGLL